MLTPLLCRGPDLYLTAMALLRSAGANHITDRVVSIRLGIAVAFIAIRLAGGAFSPQAVAVLIAAGAITAGIAIGRAWRGLSTVTT